MKIMFHVTRIVALQLNNSDRRVLKTAQRDNATRPDRSLSSGKGGGGGDDDKLTRLTLMTLAWWNGKK